MIEPWPYWAQQKALERPVDEEAVAATFAAEQMDDDEARAFLAYALGSILWSLALSAGVVLSVALLLHSG